MEKYIDNYHDKFRKAYTREFTGRIFNPVEFRHHLTNINFHFECGEVSKLSDEGIIKLKAKFRFYQYGAYLKGFITYTDEDFVELVQEYGKNMGFEKKRLTGGRNNHVV